MLDEIGEMKPALQAKLLHVLQDAEFTKLGSNKRIQVDVRVVAATNRDLEKMMESGDFREDLYYRLKVIELTVPALRERRDEIPTLTDFFVARTAASTTGRAPISEQLRQLFLQYDWPGNIRELENMIKRVIILQDEHARGPRNRAEHAARRAGRGRRAGADRGRGGRRGRRGRGGHARGCRPAGPAVVPGRCRSVLRATRRRGGAGRGRRAARSPRWPRRPR
jgi:DNA-binding NtrC family response regulator